MIQIQHKQKLRVKIHSHFGIQNKYETRNSGRKFRECIRIFLTFNPEMNFYPKFEKKIYSGSVCKDNPESEQP